MLWVILIFANGTALLLFNQTLAGTLVNLTLPAPPLSAPLVYNDNTPVPALWNGDVLTVPVLGNALITVKYVPRVAASDGVISFNVTEGYYVIWAQGGVLLLPTLTILNYTADKNAVVVVAKGPGTVAYTLQGREIPPTAAPPASTTTRPMTANTTTATAATTAQPAAAQTAATTTPLPEEKQTAAAQPVATATAAQPNTSTAPSAKTPVEIYLIAAAVAVVAALGAYVLTRRRGERAELNETDRSVLEYVRRTGGVYEAEISRALGLPRTTVFKAVRRLEREGLVEVEKRDGRNFVKPR
nr:winged helix-turn-helix transcriptional regulator [Pyrobaculum sp.]